MATSDQVVGNIEKSVAQLGASDEFLELLRFALYALIKVSIVEHITEVEAAECMFKH